jgi:putative NADH-flavin reductase
MATAQKLFILGATGGTGLELVSQGLARGHAVTALVRSPEKLPARPGLTVLKGEVTDVAALTQAMAGHDAVVFTLGPRELGPTSIYTDGMTATLAAMAAAGVRRLIVVSVAMLFPGGPIVWIVRTILRHGARNAKAMEALVEASDAQWTIVRPPQLTDKAARGKWRAAVRALPSFGFKIPRADLATFMLEVLEKDQYRRQLVGVCT